HPRSACARCDSAVTFMSQNAARRGVGFTEMATLTVEAQPPVVRWSYVALSLLAIGVMIAAIMSQNRWFLNFVHVICGVMWTGIDLFMGFIVGPILKRIDITARRE